MQVDTPTMFTQEHPGAPVPRDHRITVTFASDRGRTYLYDDATGTIFPWNPLREELLVARLRGTLAIDRRSLEDRFGTGNVGAEARFIEMWASTYRAFTRPELALGPLPTPDELKELIRRQASQLNLTVTEACNLRCRHCAFSGNYLFNRTHAQRRMSPTMALDAVDWFVNLVEPQRRLDPSRTFGLAFWGGEPTLEMGLIETVLRHLRTTCPTLFVPTFTTNGTLLTKRTVDLLVDHGVNLVVSLDGPPEEHDRRRVYSSGRGSLDRVLTNLADIKARHPEYWATKMATHPCYDADTDLEAVAAFFERHAHVIPRVSTMSGVSTKDLCDGSHLPDKTDVYLARLDRVRRWYQEVLVHGGRPTGFLETLMNLEMSSLLFRRRVSDAAIPWMPFSGGCLPGYRVTVRVDGTLDVCERVNATFPIGQLPGGFDGERIHALLSEFRRVVLRRCPSCPVSRTCRLCLAQVMGDGVVDDPESMCRQAISTTQRNLRTYVSILEENPHARLPVEWPGAPVPEAPPA